MREINIIMNPSSSVENYLSRCKRYRRRYFAINSVSECDVGGAASAIELQSITLVSQPIQVALHQNQIFTDNFVPIICNHSWGGRQFISLISKERRTILLGKKNMVIRCVAAPRLISWNFVFGHKYFMLVRNQQVCSIEIKAAFLMTSRRVLFALQASD